MIKKYKWQNTKLIMTQWVIFAMLIATFAMWWLLNDRKIRQAELVRCQTNWEAVEKQVGSGRIILDLK